MKKIRNVTLYQSLLFVGFLNAQSQIVFQPLKSNVGNILGVLAAYCWFSQKPCINQQRTIGIQFTLF